MGREITESRALWAIIAMTSGIGEIWAWSIGMKVAFSPIAVSAAVLAVYANLRSSDRRVAALAHTGAQLIAFTASAAIFIYLSVTSKFPLVDSYLAAADAAIGLDWLSSFIWIEHHPAIGLLLSLSYSSILPQVGALLVLLSITGRPDRLREFLWLFVLTLLIVAPLSWIFPAESAWVYFGVTDRVDAYHLADFTALRSGNMPEIPWRLNGLVTFPSFHAALALILIYATRGIRVIFPISLGLNVLMIASTPSMGGHYFVDVMAGLAVVPMAIFIRRSWQRWPPVRSSSRRVAA